MAPIEQPSSEVQFNLSEPFVGLFTMYYRQSNVGNHILTKNFRFHGSLKDATARARKHCEVIGAKLNFVQPLITDLIKEEAYVVGPVAGLLISVPTVDI